MTKITMQPFVAKKKTYLNEGEMATFTVFHPAIKFNDDEGYCYFPDEGTKTGLVEHTNEKDALSNAEQLYKHFVLDK